MLEIFINKEFDFNNNIIANNLIPIYKFIFKL